MQSKKVK